MRTCVQFVKSYEESIDPYSEAVLTFCAHTLTHKPEHDGLVFSCLEFIRLFAGVSPEILALRGNELLAAAFGLLLCVLPISHPLAQSRSGQQARTQT